MISANLLPPEIKADIIQSKKNGQALNYTWWTLPLLLMVAIIITGLWLTFNHSLAEVNNELNQKELAAQSFGSLEEKAKRLAERLSAIKAIDSNINEWSGVIAEVQGAMPAGAYLSSVKIDASSNVRDTISGYAKSKQEVATLRDALEKSPKFEFVDIESSVTEKDSKTLKDVENFTLSFSLTKGALK